MTLVTTCAHLRTLEKWKLVKNVASIATKGKSATFLADRVLIRCLPIPLVAVASMNAFVLLTSSLMERKLRNAMVCLNVQMNYFLQLHVRFIIAIAKIDFALAASVVSFDIIRLIYV